MEDAYIEFEKGHGEVVRIQRRNFNGKEYLDSRVYFEDDEGHWHPTKKGLCLTPEAAHALADAILNRTDPEPKGSPTR